MSKIIGPPTLTDETANMLSEFFAGEARQGVHFWSPFRIYHFSDNTSFQFCQPVLARERKDGKPGLRYEFIGAEMGSGAYGEVYHVDATLVLNDTGAVFKKTDKHGQRRVIKKEELQHDRSLSSIHNEFNMGKLAGLGSKSPVVIDERDAYMVMRNIRGEELFDLLCQASLPARKRLALTKAVLRAVKEQLRNNHILHLDISPENIIIDQTRIPIKATLIDFGFSRPEHELSERCCGKEGYTSPEMVEGGPVNANSDMYSLGLVIALIWRLDGLVLYMDNERSTIEEQAAYARTIVLDSMFTGLDDVDEESKALIKNAVSWAIRGNNEERIGIDDLIAIFDRLNLQPVAASSSQPGGSGLIWGSFFSSAQNRAVSPEKSGRSCVML